MGVPICASPHKPSLRLGPHTRSRAARTAGHGALLLLVSLLVPRSACRRQEVKVNGQNLRDTLARGKVEAVIEAIAEAIDLPGALGVKRVVFQTRGVITININSDQITPGAPMLLSNETTGATLVNAPAGAFGLADTEADSGATWLAADSGYDFQLRLYPLDPGLRSKFAYGNNHLKLSVDADSAPKSAEHDVALKDFSYFAVGASAFADDTQRQDGFQGQVDYLTSPVVTNSTYEIATGLIALPNR